VTIAVFPGSFDPITRGHLDVVRRARRFVDEVVIAIANNAGKTPVLSIETRLELARDAVQQVSGVRVEAVPGLLVEFCRAVGADVIVKGVRGGADYDAEMPMALMNRHLTGIETVFVIGDPALAHIASSLVRDVARNSGDIEDLVPHGVAPAVYRALGSARTTKE
jgi:pantetheine-phosphate adenylyltransferase